MVICDCVFSQKQTIVINEDPNSRCRRCRYYWDTKWNKIAVKIVAILAFTLLIATVVSQVIKNDDILCSNSNATYIKKTMEIQNVNKNSPKYNEEPNCTFEICDYYGTDKGCCITCFNFDTRQEAFTGIIENYYSENKCQNNLILQLIDASFPNFTIPKYWYQATAPILHLKIVMKTKLLLDISDNSFNSKNFNYTQTLVIQHPQIPYYRKFMLNGLKSLKTFEIQEAFVMETRFEHGFLQEISSTVETIQIHFILRNSEAVYNVTGSVKLKELQRIDFRYNKGLDSLPAYAFNAPQLAALNIDSSSLKTIDLKAFSNSEKIKQLTITDNNLETLSQLTFRNKLNQLYFMDNNWKCDCELNWINEVSRTDKFKTKCSNGSSFVEVYERINCTDFIPTTSTSTTVLTTTTTSTIPSSITTSTVPPTITSTLETTEGSITTTITPEKPSICKPYNSKQDMPNLNILKINNKQYMLSYNDMNTNDFDYFFFHSEISQNKYCNFNPTSGRFTGYFGPNTSFSMCRVNKIDNEMECVMGKTFPAKGDEVWLRESDKVSIILIGLFESLFCIVCSGLLVYFCLRLHPSLLKIPNKQYVFYKSAIPNNDIRIHPRTLRPIPFPRQIYPLHRQIPRRQETFPTRSSQHPYICEETISYVPISEAPYFTPISERYMLVRRPSLQRSVSDLSMKTVASYVTENQILSWRKKIRKERTPVMFMSEEPPPLPPPRKKYDSVVLENERSRQSRHY